MKKSRPAPLPEMDVSSVSSIVDFAKKHWRRMNEMPDKVKDLVGDIVDVLVGIEAHSGDLDKKIRGAVDAWKQSILEDAIKPKPATRKTRSRSSDQTKNSSKNPTTISSSDDHECA